MKLYHGTNKKFINIDLMASKPNKDFGRGFYLSPDYEQALNANTILFRNRKGYIFIKSYTMIDEKELMKCDIVTKLAVLLVEDGRSSTMTDAIDTVVNSETYQRLMDDRTALYFQSPRYVYDFLRNEIITGKAK